MAQYSKFVFMTVNHNKKACFKALLWSLLLSVSEMKLLTGCLRELVKVFAVRIQTNYYFTGKKVNLHV